MYKSVGNTGIKKRVKMRKIAIEKNKKCRRSSTWSWQKTIKNKS